MLKNNPYSREGEIVAIPPAGVSHILAYRYSATLARAYHIKSL